MTLIRSLSIVAATLMGGAFAIAETRPDVFNMLIGNGVLVSQQAKVPAIQSKVVAKNLSVPKTKPKTKPMPKQSHTNQELTQRLADLEEAQRALKLELASVLTTLKQAKLKAPINNAPEAPALDPWLEHEQVQAEVAATAKQKFEQESGDIAVESTVAAWFGQMSSELSDSPFSAIAVEHLECRQTICEATLTAGDDASASALRHVISSYIGDEGYLASLTPISDIQSLATIALHR